MPILLPELCRYVLAERRRPPPHVHGDVQYPAPGDEDELPLLPRGELVVEAPHHPPDREGRVELDRGRDPEARELARPVELGEVPPAVVEAPRPH
jgi:hypothetical protein